MSAALRVLIVEDSEDDALLLVRELRGAGFGVTFERVDTPTAMAGALDRQTWDVVITDYSMPYFSGMAALALVKERGLDLPFIFVSGTIGEDTAVMAMKMGAHDYIMKGNLRRLIPAIERELREAEVRRERARAEDEVRRQREALLQREKLVAMGQLLAGVAHELNNPLSVLLGQTALLRQVVGAGPATERAEKIAHAAERCARIVRNFLALARQHPPERQRVVLNHVVQEAAELLAYPLRVDGVELRLQLASDLPSLWADPHQLHQVLVNLVTNTHHAMRETPPPRRLTITTRYDAGARRVLLEVADTGPGILPDSRARIFEPFFTTKPEGQGTGLGLSLCQGIVEAHRGTIRVESQPGHGAVFVVELPVVTPPAAVTEDRPSEALRQITGKVILVVDDEPDVAGVLADLLSHDGHEVDTAASGTVALQKLGERAYDLILSDIRMPELDGPGLYRELERRHPELCRRFVFLTGDTLGPETMAFLERTRALSLTKPFVLEEIRRVIQRALRAG